MKHIFAILSVCLVVVNCQQSRPPRPPPIMDPKGTPIPMPMPTPAAVSPPRPKGCSPGCGPTEICAELGASYCRSGQVCSVCIKMSSIRFPASALAGMFSQQSQPKPVQPVVQAQPAVQVMPQPNPLNTSNNATLGQVSDTASPVIDHKKPETQISIIEYAAKQRNLLTSKDNGNTAEFPSEKTKLPPPPPPPPTNSYQVIEGNSNLKINVSGVDINSIQDKTLTSASVKRTAEIDLGKMDTKQVKYPIIVTVPDSPNSVNTASTAKGQKNAALLNSSVGQTISNTQGESHLGHIDQTQMAKWYERYQMFKAQQAKLNGRLSKAPTPTPDAFDFVTFQKFQQWLQQSQKQTTAEGQTTLAQTSTTPVITPIPAIQPTVRPILPVAMQTIPTTTTTAQQPNALFNDYNSLQQQYNRWLLQQQNSPAGAVTTQQPVSLGTFAQPGLPVAQVPVQPQNAARFASMQQQLLQWQQQQMQNQANAAAVQPQVNAVAGVSQPAAPVSQTQTPAQKPTFDYAAFQKQYQQWQQDQAKINQAQSPNAAAGPTVDYTALQQQWQKQQHQQQGQGQNASVSNNQQTLQISSQEIQSNNQQNSQTSQQQNTFSYMPQQPANNFNNDPFYYNYQPPQQNTFTNYYNPPPQNNNMMDMMLLGGLGFGGGLFGF